MGGWKREGTGEDGNIRGLGRIQMCGDIKAYRCEVNSEDGADMRLHGSIHT
jgi:hypothetical protein